MKVGLDTYGLLAAGAGKDFLYLELQSMALMRVILFKELPKGEK